MRLESLTKGKGGTGHVPKVCLVLALAMVLSIGVVPMVGDDASAAVSSNTIMPVNQITSSDTNALEGRIQIDTWSKLTKIGSGEVIDGKTYGMNSKYVQMANLTAPAGEHFTPIGDNPNFFTGEYDGNGYTITGMRINAHSGGYAGMFGCAVDAVLRNIALEGGAINIANESGASLLCIGGIVGDISDSFLGKVSRITNCYNTGSVKHEGNVPSEVGGIAGSSSISKITNCYSTGAITGVDHVGGISGKAFGNISGCYNIGSILSGYNAGGIVGSLTNGTIQLCYNNGSVFGKGYSGGIAGALGGQTVKAILADCYNKGAISTSGLGDVGGIVGLASNNVSIANCYSSGTIAGTSYIGGIVGFAGSNATVNVHNAYFLSSSGLTLLGGKKDTAQVETYGGINNGGYSIEALRAKSTYNTLPLGPSDNDRYGWAWNENGGGPWKNDSSDQLPYLLLSLAAEKGTISLTPNSRTINVKVGDEAKISISADVSSVTYRWERQTGALWESVPGGTSSDLTLGNATLDMDGGKYRCVVSKDGYETATSGTFTLSVSESNSDGGGGSSTMIYIGAAIAIVAVIGALAYVFVIRKP